MLTFVAHMCQKLSDLPRKSYDSSSMYMLGLPKNTKLPLQPSPSPPSPTDQKTTCAKYWESICSYLAKVKANG